MSFENEHLELQATSPYWKRRGGHLSIVYAMNFETNTFSTKKANNTEHVSKHSAWNR